MLLLINTTEFECGGEGGCKLRSTIPFEFRSLNDCNHFNDDDRSGVDDRPFNPFSSSSSISDEPRNRTLVSKWVEAASKASKIGKGLMNDPNARKMRETHWLEAIDLRHRYGPNLMLYYDTWLKSKTYSQSFFHWLDVGGGKGVVMEGCLRNVLQSQCVKYLEAEEREEYEVVAKNGRLVYRKSHIPLETDSNSKWIFLLSTTKNLYVGQKKKGVFHHSSFIAGGVASSAGRLIAKDGFLKAIWPSSGHYHPKEEDFEKLVGFLQANGLDLTNVVKLNMSHDDEKIEDS